MSSINFTLYRSLIDNYKKATGKSNQATVLEVARIWNTLKSSEGFPNNAKEEIQKWKVKADKNKGTLDSFWATLPKKQPTSTEEVAIINDIEQPAPQPSPSSSSHVNLSHTRTYSTPAEDKLKVDLQVLQNDIIGLEFRIKCGLATDEEIKLCRTKKGQQKEKSSELKNLLSSRERQRKKRANVDQVLKDNPDVAKKLSRRATVGRPRCEDDQPELLKTIVDIAIYGSSADRRRRSDLVGSVKTLDELTSELNNRGFQLSRSAVYLRLLPRRSASTEGKRHIRTVPVRLKRPQNDAHKSHVDAEFCRASIRYLEEVASVLGPCQVLFLSQDDKARVPIGITAANKQAPMLMHLDYQVKLPDHDWVLAERHKLIPSVYGVMEIKPKKMGDLSAVSYSGPTFIAVRSGKHCSSTALSHARDLNVLLNDSEFVEFARDKDGNVKPIVIIIVDGGPDENPRYEKVIWAAIDHFKNHNLDAIFIATNAPGRSAFNRVERRMAPLSRELCGVILKHDTFGTHLDNQGRTVNEDLEKQNFEHAGKVLAEIWNSVTLDGCITKAAYVSPDESENALPALPTAEWRTRHVRESHYFLQVVKCTDPSCCTAMRGNYTKLFPRFLPAPVCVDQTSMQANDNSELTNEFPSLMLRLRVNDEALKNCTSKEVPYDTCCPSVRELIPCRTCNNCGLYFSSVKSVKQHRTICQNRNQSHPALNANPFGTQMLTQRRNNRPVRVAARRQQERMVIWTSRLTDAHADWFDDEELNQVEVEPINLEPAENNNIIGIDQHLDAIWEDGDE